MMKAIYRDDEMRTILKEVGFTICKCLDSKGMTDRYFSEYNRNEPEHQMAASAGVSYIFSVKEK